MRPFVIVAMILALAGFARPGAAQFIDIVSIRFERVANGSPVVSDRLVLRGPQGRLATGVCVDFHNSDRRPVKSVRSPSFTTMTPDIALAATC